MVVEAIAFEPFSTNFNRKPEPGGFCFLGLINEKPPTTCWSSLMSAKPYDPPFQCSVSSLAMCTETLGSETGSEEYSSDSSSDTCDSDVKFVVLKATRRRLERRSFPPPLSSLGGRDGSCLVMKSSRDNGRLVVEAVTVPKRHNFIAKRHSGRLILSLMAEERETTEPQKVKVSLEMPRMVIIGELSLLIRKPLVKRRWGAGVNEVEEDEDGGRRKEMVIGQYGCKDRRPSLSFWEPRCIATT